MNKWTLSFEKKLLSAKDYRHFLHAFFQKEGSSANSTSRISYQSFAMRAGFASKSFIADVIAERKRLTLRSFDKTVAGLSLNKQWTEYFRCLVALEEPEFYNAKLFSQDHNQKRLKKLHDRLSAKANSISIKSRTPTTDILLHRYSPEIFASLGTIEDGATLEQIAARSKVSSDLLKEIIEKFEKINLLEFKPSSGTWHLKVTAVDIENLLADENFEMDYFHSLDKAKKRFKAQAKTEQALFMTQTFSVDSKFLPTFKIELARLIEEFSEKAEAAEGDTVAEICIAFSTVF